LTRPSTNTEGLQELLRTGEEIGLHGRNDEPQIEWGIEPLVSSFLSTQP
jgi:hypothetical protein